MNWQEFVIQHGARVRIDHLARILAIPASEIQDLRRRQVCVKPKGKAPGFGDIFTLWHGRSPREDDWPKPVKSRSGHYEWMGPELALLASVVGTMSVKQIGLLLTKRLREVTGDRRAKRDRGAVQNAITRSGLQASELLGGLTVQQAAVEIGSTHTLYQAINTGELVPTRIGNRFVISRTALETWKGTRVLPPAGYVPLASIRISLGIKSDSKLPEFANAGYIPTATRCNPYGSGRGTKNGTWWVDNQVAQKLVADRHAGRSMPWHGKVYDTNLKITWQLLEARRHPPECKTCRNIWGNLGSPMTFEDYSVRYPPLVRNDKFHLTRPWAPGLSLAEVGKQAGRSLGYVDRAVQNGALKGQRAGRFTYITQANCARWIAQGSPAGAAVKTWIALSTAKRLYGFSIAELLRYIKTKKLQSRIGVAGPQLNLVFVLRQQCGKLRDTLGYPEREAARRVGVTVAQLHTLLAGVGWSGGGSNIPVDMVLAARKRFDSQKGYTVEEAAERLGKTREWVNEQIRSGVARVSRAAWDGRLRYLNEQNFQRLRRARKIRSKARPLSSTTWLRPSDAAKDSGVCTGTLQRWADEGIVRRRKTSAGWRYARISVRSQAKKYWATLNRRRAVPPAWLPRHIYQPEHERDQVLEPPSLRRRDQKGRRTVRHNSGTNARNRLISPAAA